MDSKQPTIGILADDLTGSLDAGLQLHLQGITTEVCLPQWGAVGSADARAVVIDTESRDVPAPDARERVRGGLRALRAHGIPVLYRKIDSTLRGSIAAELRELITLGACRTAVVAPSLPAQGRTVIDGILSVHGAPVGAASLPVLLREAQLRVEPIGLGMVRAGGEEPAARVRGLMTHGVEVIVADAETDGDLTHIARAIMDIREGLLPCGSAGLCGHLAGLGWFGCGRSCGGSQGDPAQTSDADRPHDRDGGVLVVCGSAAPVARLQVAEALRMSGSVGVRLPADRLFSERERDDEVARAARTAGAAVRRGSVGVVYPDDPEPAIGDEAVRRHRLVARALGEAARLILLEGFVAGVILCGGDTAAAVCRSVGARGIRIEGESEAYVPRGRLLGGECHGLPVVTKAGGFGDSLSVVRAIRGLLSVRVGQDVLDKTMRGR